MAHDEQVAEEIRKSLKNLKFEEKRMFGRVGFMVNKKLCVAASSKKSAHVMLVRIDPSRQKEALKRKGAEVAIMRGRKVEGWIFLNGESVKSENDFNFWINLA